MLSNPYWRLMRFDRPVGTFLLLWPTLWAVWIAGQGQPDLRIVIIFTLGVIIMRAAGSIVNDIADRNIDGLVKRTQARPLATGELSLRQALLAFFALLSLAGLLVLQLNWLTCLMAFLGACLAVIYPFSKRFFACPQLVLGLTWSWGLLMAFTAQLHALPMVAWLLYLTHLLLTIAYDTMYAMVDRDDDLQIGVHSSAILFGRFDKAMVAVCQMAVLLLLVVIGVLCQMQTLYYVLLTPAAGLMIYQQWLIRARERMPCLRAFLNNQWLGFAVWVAIVVGLK